MGIASLIIGLLGGVIMLVALLPLLGWINWFNNIFVGLGWILGLVAILKDSKNGVAIVGLIICTLVLLTGTIRLIVGGGIL